MHDNSTRDNGKRLLDGLLISFALIIVSVGSIVAEHRLGRRIDALQQRVDALEARPESRLP